MDKGQEDYGNTFTTFLIILNLAIRPDVFYLETIQDKTIKQ